MKGWPKEYKILKGLKSMSIDSYEIKPLRFKDRYEIMRWRNDQLYHLRQKFVLKK